MGTCGYLPIYYSDIFPDYLIVESHEGFWLCVIGWDDRVERFENWLAKYTPNLKMRRISEGWKIFPSEAFDKFDVILSVQGTDPTQLLFFKMVWM